ncbi:MAG: ureidoglycolate lyase [Gammaproteobacteria bacterium]|nr:ureidoglycolate lyase [Gammaproteobacteria bacterium]
MILQAATLTREAFAPFGDVIQCAGSQHFSINAGTTERYHDLANVDVTMAGGRPIISIFVAQPVPQNPVDLRLMERHPLASQAFMPLSANRFLAVVAPPGEELRVQELRAFMVTAGQGINYSRDVWHHPVLALDTETHFLIVDRDGPGHNCDEIELPTPVQVAF